MIVLKSYGKSHEAYSDAAYLCGMGIDAVVMDERGYGGDLLGNSPDAIRIEVVEEQLDEALMLLETRDLDARPPETPFPNEALPDEPLVKFYRKLLITTIFLQCIFLFFWEYLVPEESDSSLLMGYLDSMAFAPFLDFYAWIYWPQMFFWFLAIFLSYHFFPIGREFYLLAVVLWLLTYLIQPIGAMPPLASFLSGILGLASNVALALMYFSPLNEKFKSREQSNPTHTEA